MKANIEDLRASMIRLDRSIQEVSALSARIGDKVQTTNNNHEDSAQLREMVRLLNIEMKSLRDRNAELETALPLALEKVDLALQAVDTVLGAPVMSHSAANAPMKI